MAIHILKNGLLKVVINDEGGTIDAMTYGDKTPFNILRPRVEDGTCFAGNSSLFPMVPLVNRISNNQFWWENRLIKLPINKFVDANYFLHGDGWLTKWEKRELQKEVSEGEVLPLDQSELYLSMHSNIEGICAYKAEQHYILEKNKLTIIMCLTNIGSVPFPFGMGFHPFFHCLPDTLVQFKATGFWLEDDNYLPTKYDTNIPDDFSFEKKKKVPEQWINNGYRMDDNGIDITLHHQDALTILVRSNCHFLQVYKPKGISNFICLEPQSQFVNAHNSPCHDSLTVLQYQESISILMSISVID